MDFTFNRTDPTSQPHSIFGVMLTLPDFGVKKIHKIHHVSDPDPEYSSHTATHPSSGHPSFRARLLYQ
jgi:hypothetical protein